MESFVDDSGRFKGSNVARKGCMVGLATVGAHSWEFTRSLLWQAQPLNYRYNFSWVVGRPLAEAYNMIFDIAKRGDYELLFLMEEDTIAPQEAWVRLLNKMRYNPDIFAVSGVYPRKLGGDPTPFFYRGNLNGPYLDWVYGEFFEVTGLPFGCLVLRIDMLKEIDDLVGETYVKDYPEIGEGSWVKAYCRMNVPMADPAGQSIEIVSQDIYFSEMARKAGLRLYVDSSVVCHHLNINTGIKYEVPKLLHTGWEPPDNGDKTAINLGCGTDFGFIHGIKPLRVDIREEVEPDLRLDLRDMSGLEKEGFDYVYSSHTLEHFLDEDSKRIFSEMVRICKPGGEIHIVVPNVLGAAKLLSQGQNDPAIWWHIFGKADAPWNEHKTGFTTQKIVEWCREHSLMGVVMVDRVLNICVRAFKPPLPDWFDEWRNLDKKDWTQDRFFNYELEDPPEPRKIRVGRLNLPVSDNVLDENIEAFFTPTEKDGEDTDGNTI